MAHYNIVLLTFLLTYFTEVLYRPPLRYTDLLRPSSRCSDLHWSPAISSDDRRRSLLQIEDNVPQLYRLYTVHNTWSRTVHYADHTCSQLPGTGPSDAEKTEEGRQSSITLRRSRVLAATTHADTDYLPASLTAVAWSTWQQVKDLVHK